MNILRQLLSMVIVALILSTGSISAQAGTSEATVQTTQIKERDAFIDECVREFANSKVTYDGETLTLCKVPDSRERIRAIILMVLSVVPLSASWLCGENPLMPNFVVHRKARALCALGGLLLFGYALNILCDESDYLKNNVPLITLTNKGLLFDGKEITWDQVDQIKTIIDRRGRSCRTTLSLCDEFLNAKLTLKDINIRSPLSVDDLAELINYYIDKDKKIKNKLPDSIASDANASIDAFIKRFVAFAASNSVTFDGKTLTLHHVLNKTEIAKSALFTTIALVIGGLSLVMAVSPGNGVSGSSGKNFLAGSVLSLICIGYFIYYFSNICKNITYGICNIPLITMTDKGILFEKTLITWNSIKSIKDKTVETRGRDITTTTHTISLYDGNGKCIHSFTNIGDHLPVTTDNLIALMNHYIEKARQLEGNELQEA